MCGFLDSTALSHIYLGWTQHGHSTPLSARKLDTACLFCVDAAGYLAVRLHCCATLPFICMLLCCSAFYMYAVLYAVKLHQSPRSTIVSYCPAAAAMWLPGWPVSWPGNEGDQEMQLLLELGGCPACMPRWCYAKQLYAVYCNVGADQCLQPLCFRSTASREVEGSQQAPQASAHPHSSYESMLLTDPALCVHFCIDCMW